MPTEPKIFRYFCAGCGLGWRYGKSFARHLEIKHGIGERREGLNERLGEESWVVEIIRHPDSDSAFVWYTPGPPAV